MSFFTELPDFLSDDESERIIDLAEMFGLENSYMHSDEFQEQHKKDVKGTMIGLISSSLVKLRDSATAFSLFFTDILPFSLKHSA